MVTADGSSYCAALYSRTHDENPPRVTLAPLLTVVQQNPWKMSTSCNTGPSHWLFQSPNVSRSWQRDRYRERLRSLFKWTQGWNGSRKRGVVSNQGGLPSRVPLCVQCKIISQSSHWLLLRFTAVLTYSTQSHHPYSTSGDDTRSNQNKDNCICGDMHVKLMMNC